MCVVWGLLSHPPPRLPSLICRIHHSNPGPLPSLRSSSVMSVMQRCILHAASYKQTVSVSYRVISPGYVPSSRPFYLPSIFCYIRHIRFTNAILPSRPTSCPAPIMSVTPNNSPLQLYHLPLNCHTCYFFLLSPLPLSAARCSASKMDMQLGVWAGAVLNIKSESPDRRFFLDRICLSRSHRHLRCCRLHLLTSPRPSQPFDCVDNSCLTMGEWQLHFAMCYSHPHTLKLITLQITVLPKNSLPFSCFSPAFISGRQRERHFVCWDSHFF